MISMDLIIALTVPTFNHFTQKSAHPYLLNMIKFTQSTLSKSNSETKKNPSIGARKKPARADKIECQINYTIKL